ncbi:uncharacterized protein LOC121635687 isoform X2 [Melanotaenia boesemani]|uniref:uncharacterized protein LOC121635687 isoform X2 n=1 Tax=Melanotaenia boesemani TaxID=1250792 RepID=UPI001C05876B|nr:uncharacterized protein LOC121635687 isoform X2 [Melanotaenia boesemani]
MAEESSTNELEGLEKQIQCLLSRYSGDEFQVDSEPFCSDFCKLVEEYASHWQVPLPQLRILEIALRYFARASTFFTSNCDHVHQTISSLALSIFELLLFFDQKDFNQEPLKNFTATFQECHLVLAEYQNVHLLQVEHLVQGDGPWASPALQGILSRSSLPQNEVEGCINSELPVFFELRVRYLLSCERVSEAMALAKCCADHPTAGQHLFFLQVYLSWLYKTSQHALLHKEVAEVNGKDAVHIICSLECEEKDELLLGLSTAFLSQQLCRGDMYYLCDLVLVWVNLHRRLKTSKQALQEECHRLMLSATNVKSIFPFIRAILQEVGAEGIQFCVELCAHALQACLPCDVVTKSLIYKTIAGLLSNDLEVCRTCALLVFFLERSVESYKMVYLLYMHPDQEYHMDDGPIRNNVRFETLQVLKKDLYFDPEFWNLIALRTSCLKLMSEKVVSAALEEIMEDKWISKYCAKEPSLQSRAAACRKGDRNELHAVAKKRHHKEDVDVVSKRLKMGANKMRLNDHAVRRKGNQGSQVLKQSSGALRRSFWQLDRMHSSLAFRYEEHRRTTRLSEKNPPKRRIRQPKWLLQDSGTLEENVSLKVKKNGLKRTKHIRSCVMKRSEHGQNKNTKLKPLINSHLKAKENDKVQNGFSADQSLQASPPQVILELSLPDNELLGSFAEDACSRPRGFPQVLLYKPTLKLPAAAQPAKPIHRKEVVLRARDATMFIQLLHCYARRQKGKGNGPNVHSSVSTITRSSVQGSPPKDPSEKAEMKEVTMSKTTVTAKDMGVLEKVPKIQSTKPLSQKASTRELSETSVELKVASQTTGADKVTNPPDSNRISKAQSTAKVSQSINYVRAHPENSSVKLRDTTLSQTSSAAEVVEVPDLCELPQIQTVASAKEPCEEPAVEMKVTIASQSTILEKVSKAPAVEQVSKARVSKTTTTVKIKRKATGENHSVSLHADVSSSESADPAPLYSQNVALRVGEEELMSLPSQGESGSNSVTASISTMDVTDALPKNSKGHVPCKNDTSPGTSVIRQNKPSETEASYVLIDQTSPSDISALTLVTEMVTELSPEQLSQKQETDKLQTPDSSTSKDSRDGRKSKVHHKTRTTSSCSTSEQDASVEDTQGEKGKANDPDDSSDSPENSELMEMVPESEESKLDFCCTFCSKEFKGSRVVEHAMFHFRKDECMFCRMTFKDDLLAMMHLSDHIEKLKRIKDQKNGVSDTVCTTTAKTPGCGSKGKQRKLTVSPKSGPSESRTLRSKDKQVCGTFPQEKPSRAKDLNNKTAVHKVNGHIGKKRELTRLKSNLDANQKPGLQETPQKRTRDGAASSSLEENNDIEIDSSAVSPQRDEFTHSTEDKKKKTESLQVLKMASKQNGNVPEEKNVEPQEKVFCPVDGCSWCTDLSKNRVALLYHALEDHYGDIKPLELAFRVGNSKCSICMRVCWSFEHFQHHVERHKLIPRHPCLHQGCMARFKTGMEMRRHARKHSPLQAVCCLPGCSKLFICLWALNLHERDHYASKSVKPDKNTSVQKGDKPSKAPIEKKPQSSEDTTASTAGKSTESVKAAHMLGQQATHDLEARKTSPVIKNEHKGSNVLTNLSNKDTSAQPAVRNLRLRQILRKVKARSTVPPASKVHKVISSSLLKHNRKVKLKLEEKQVKGNEKGLKRKGRPPKLNKAVHDENITAGQKLSSESVKISSVSNKLKVDKKQEVQNEVKATEKSAVDLKTETTEGKQTTRKHNISLANSSNQRLTSDLKTQKPNAVKAKNLHMFKKHYTTSDSSKAKKYKIVKSKVNKNAVEKKCHNQDPAMPSASKKPSKPKSQVKAKVAAVESSADEERKAKEENTGSSHHSVLSIPSKGLNLPSSSEKPQKVKRVDKLKKSVAKQGNSRCTASSDLGKVKKRNMEWSKKQVDKKLVKKKGQSKSQVKSLALKKMAEFKCEVQQQDEAKGKTTFEEGTTKEKASDATLNSPAPSEPAHMFNKTCLPAAPEINEQKVHKKEKSKKANVTSKSEANKASKKRRDSHKDDAKQLVKKKLKDHQTATKKSAKSAKVQPAAEESSAGESGKTLPSAAIDYFQMENGPASSEESKSTLSKDYRKRPYMRPPPTAYLDEKFITMPKKRKEMPVSVLLYGNAWKAAALQRQRCANCFATFDSTEELQNHLQLKKCSNLFGFDSDDEGNS